MSRLSDIAEVTVGQIIQRVVGNKVKNGNVKVLVPKAITEGGVDEASIDYITLSKDVSEDKYTKSGDVVIKLSTPFAAAYIDEEHAGMLIPSFCAVIRFQKRIDSRCMCAILNSSYIQDQMKSMLGGEIRPMIKVTDLRSVEIPEISESDMRLLGEEYMKSAEKRKILLQLVENEQMIMDNTVLGFIKGALK